MYPQYEIATIELKNDRIERVLYSEKANQLKPHMPIGGFHRHCTAQLGSEFYVIGGQGRAGNSPGTENILQVFSNRNMVTPQQNSQAESRAN